MKSSDTSAPRAKPGERPTASVPAQADPAENSSSTIIEAPARRKRRLDAHDFPDGGGSGGAEAFSRKRLGKP